MYLFVDWLINGFMKEICEFLFSSVGKQLENWHLACVFDTCHLALDEGSLLPKIVGVTSHVYGFGVFFFFPPLPKNLLLTAAGSIFTMGPRSLYL